MARILPRRGPNTERAAVDRGSEILDADAELNRHFAVVRPRDCDELKLPPEPSLHAWTVQ
jgi:hypothetical protein